MVKVKKKEVKKAENAFSDWKKMMPFYYGAVWVILLLIVFLK